MNVCVFEIYMQTMRINFAIAGKDMDVSVGEMNRCVFVVCLCVGWRSDIQRLKLYARLILSSICVHYFMHAMNRKHTRKTKPNHCFCTAFPAAPFNDILLLLVSFLLLRYFGHCERMTVFVCVCSCARDPLTKYNRLSSCTFLKNRKLLSTGIAYICHSKPRDIPAHFK